MTCLLGKQIQPPGSKSNYIPSLPYSSNLDADKSPIPPAQLWGSKDRITRESLQHTAGHCCASEQNWGQLWTTGHQETELFLWQSQRALSNTFNDTVALDVLVILTFISKCSNYSAGFCQVLIEWHAKYTRKCTNQCKTYWRPSLWGNAKQLGLFMRLW